VDRSLVAFGVVFLIVGVGTGWLMYAHPEGLNPAWPIWMALLAPAVFVLGGLHLIATGLRQPRLSSSMLLAIVICLWAIVNWAAFFTTGIQCVVTASFLGAPIVDWYPSETECRESLRAIIAAIDALLLIAVGVSVWRRYRIPRQGESTD
jgi:hypothetical protein